MDKPTKLLQHEVHQLCMENQHQKQKRAAPRSFIQTGGSFDRLTGAEGLQNAQEQEAIMEEARQPSSRPRRPPTCCEWIKLSSGKNTYANGFC